MRARVCARACLLTRACAGVALHLAVGADAAVLVSLGAQRHQASLRGGGHRPHQRQEALWVEHHVRVRMFVVVAAAAVCCLLFAVAEAVLRCFSQTVLFNVIAVLDNPAAAVFRLSLHR